MNDATFRPRLVWMGLLAAALLATPPAARAQLGTIAGRVTDQERGQPLGGARVAFSLPVEALTRSASS